MGSVELSAGEITIVSHIVIYGSAASEELAESIRTEIESMWNEPTVFLHIEGPSRKVRFRITSSFSPHLTPFDVVANTDPRNNYFRIEEFAQGNISFVDGIGCNTGYFKKENLYIGSTTAAHEYGHTLGLEHPHDLDIRGTGVPGIMYPRGTLVDAEFQYNPAGRAGDSTNGGTMHPRHRRVRVEDILQLNLHRVDLTSRDVVIGEFSSIWHEDHLQTGFPPDISA